MTGQRISPTSWIQLSLIIVGAFVLVNLSSNESFNTLSIIFVSILIEAVPFMLLGTVVGGLVEAFVPRSTITKFLPAGSWRSIFIGGAIGAIFPVCECAIVPVVRRFLKKGIPVGAAVAFLLAGPIVNPVVATSTFVAYFFNWQVVLMRVGMGYVIAVTIGIAMETLMRGKEILKTDDAECATSCGHDHEHRQEKIGFIAKIKFAMRIAAEDFFDIGRYLVMGALITAIIQTYVARSTIFDLIASLPWLAIPLMMILAFILNLCSEADAFIAASFQSTAIPFTGQLAFMVLGPMLDIKLLMMYSGVFKRRFIITLATLTPLTVLLAMLILEALR